MNPKWQEVQVQVHAWLNDQMELATKQANEKDKFSYVHRAHNVRINLGYFEHHINNGHHFHFCKQCGVIELATYVEPIGAKLKEDQLCFACNLWEERLQEHLVKPKIIVEGTQYSDGGATPKGSRTDWNGFGGALWRIRRLADGHTWETNNLWCGGDIPKEFRDRGMVDNHEFLKPERN